MAVRRYPDPLQAVVYVLMISVDKPIPKGAVHVIINCPSAAGIYAPIGERTGD